MPYKREWCSGFGRVLNSKEKLCSYMRRVETILRLLFIFPQILFLMLYLSPLPPLNLYLPTRSLLSFSSLCLSLCSFPRDNYTLPLSLFFPLYLLQPLFSFAFSINIRLPYLSLPQSVTSTTYLPFSLPHPLTYFSHPFQPGSVCV